MKLRCIVVMFLLWLCINVLSYAQAAELFSEFHPYVSIKEEYSDNVKLTSTNKIEDFITTVQPGIKFSTMDKMSGVDLDYSLGAVSYSKNSNLNYISHNGSLNAKYLTSQHINFYLKESFIRSEDPQEREYFTTADDNKYMLSTKTDRAVYWRNVLAPTIEYMFGPENRIGVNYRNNLYRIDGGAGEDSQENYINPFISYWFNKRNGIALDYGFTRGDFEYGKDLTGHRANIHYTNRLSENFSVFTEYSFSRRTFTSHGEDYDVHEPAVGITHALTPTLNASAQVGYFWKKSDIGPTINDYSYKGELRNIDPRTTFQISLQGGYTEDLFTSENLGFNRYHRITGSLTHRLEKHISVGGFASFEKAEFDSPEHNDKVWRIGGRVSYAPMKWLTLAMEVSYKERQSDVSIYEYTESRGMFTVTAAY